MAPTEATTGSLARVRLPRLLRSRLEGPVLAPIRAFRLAYLPLLTIYLASGALGIIAVADTFWVKQSLTLTPAELASLAVWLQLPWTAKMVLSEFVDCPADLRLAAPLLHLHRRRPDRFGPAAAGRGGGGRSHLLRPSASTYWRSCWWCRQRRPGGGGRRHEPRGGGAHQRRRQRAGEGRYRSRPRHGGGAGAAHLLDRRFRRRRHRRRAGQVPSPTRPCS